MNIASIHPLEGARFTQSGGPRSLAALQRKADDIHATSEL